MKGRIIALLAAFAFAAAAADAQTGLEAGYLNSRYSVKSDGAGASLSDYSLNGFYVGFTDDVRLFAGLHVQPGIYYSYQTDKSVEDVLGFRLNGGVTDHYLSVPVLLKYKFGLPGVKLYVFGGPTMSVGLVSKQKFTVAGSFGGAVVNGDISYNYFTGNVRYDGIELMADAEDPYRAMLPDFRYNRFDVQMGAGVGIELVSLIEIKAGYDWGLLNRYRGDGLEIRRDQFYVAVGLRF